MIANPKCALPGASSVGYTLSGSSVKANNGYKSGKRKKRHRQDRRRATAGHVSLQKKTSFSSVKESPQPIPDRLQERLGELSTEERQKIAKLTGYRQIGKPLPEGTSILDVIRTFPPEVYDLNHWRAWSALATTISAIVMGYMCTALAPWFLLPLTWFFTGTAATGLFVLGHDCGHYVFHSARWVNDLIGNIVMTPLIYPYEPWKIMHNLHHVHTNKLNKDTGWHPVLADRFEEGSAGYTAIKAVLGTPLKLWLSIVHWIKLHFSPAHFTSKQMLKVTVSWTACFAFAMSLWSVLILKFGLGGWVKFWLMPWLVYHFWMSTFTLVHHTAPHIPFQRQEDYHGARAKLGGTVHCDFPRWVEFLCHDINVHIPHHVSARIPFYNLRAATESLRKNWGQYMTECSFNWRMMRNFFTEIHLYDVGKEYVAFDMGKKEDPLLAVQRQFLPDTM